MRTTLTLDDDLAVELEQLRETRKLSLKELVNETIRLGLRSMKTAEERPKERYRTRSHDLGKCLIGNIDNIGEVLALAEGDDYR